jgi:phenylacetate-CoA ligase
MNYLKIWTRKDEKIIMQQKMKRRHPSNIALQWSDSHISVLEEYLERYEQQGRSVESLSSVELEEYHLFAINLTLRHVWDNNPYYRTHLEKSGFKEPKIDSLSEFGRVPYLLKDTLRGHKHLLLSVDPDQICQYHLTSGTTGKSIYTAHTLADQYYHDAIPTYPYIFKGDSASDVVGIALPYEFAQPALGFHRMYQFSCDAAVLSLGKGGYMAPVDKSIEALRDFDVTILITTPSYAAILAEEAQKLGVSVNGLRVRKLLLTGEGCSPEFTKRLKEIWGCEINHMYGSTECGLVGVQRDGEQGYYLMEGGIHAEVIDPETAVPVENGIVGEIVITTLLKEAMPFVRYRSGDIGYIENANPHDEVQLKKLYLRGRMGAEIMVEGVEYSPIMLEHCLLMLPEIGLWYRFLLDNDELTIEVELVPGAVINDEFLDMVKQHMYRTTGVVCTIVINNEIPRQFSKAQRVFYKKEEAIK